MTLPASPPRYALRLVLAAIGTVCLWSETEATRLRYGYGVSAEALPLGAATKARLAGLVKRFQAASDDAPIKPANPLGPDLFGYEAVAATFADEVAELAETLRRELGPAYALRHELTAPPALTAGWNRPWTLIAAPAAAALGAFALWLAGAIALQGFGDMTGFGRVVLAAMFAAFGALFMLVAFTYGRARGDRAPVVAIDGSGILDRRLSRAPIPWSAIAGLGVARRGAITIALKDGARAPLPEGALWVVNRLAGGLSRTSSLVVKPIGVALRFGDLVAAAMALRPPTP